MNLQIIGSNPKLFKTYHLKKISLLSILIVINILINVIKSLSEKIRKVLCLNFMYKYKVISRKYSIMLSN